MIFLSKNVNLYKNEGRISMLKRKITKVLEEWKNDHSHKPLIISGARQIGKTTAVKEFAKKRYESIIDINFILDKEFKSIFDNSFTVDSIIKNISIIRQFYKFIPYKTLIFFDEVNANMDALTSLKSFALDGRYDVICSGSALGVSMNRVSSVSVGFEEQKTMYSLDFEEFLWNAGFTEEQIEEVYGYLKSLKPLPKTYFDRLSFLFREYIAVGGMPEIVNRFLTQNTYYKILDSQKNLFKDYEADITHYTEGLDSARVLNFYRNISSQLAKENKKFIFRMLGKGQRSKNYGGVQEWLSDAGVINIAYNLKNFTLPLSSSYEPDNFRVYFADTSLLIASMDEESQKDFLVNKNIGVYKGAIFENCIAESLIKQGYERLYFYRSEYGEREIDFIVRQGDHLVPLEVKANHGKAMSLNNMLLKDSPSPFPFGIKFSLNNIGYFKKVFTFPYFLSFLLKRLLEEVDLKKYVEDNERK